MINEIVKNLTAEGLDLEEISNVLCDGHYLARTDWTQYQVEIAYEEVKNMMEDQK